jgi:hypothetical protein
LKAVAETLASFSLRPEALALVRMFGSTGKRVSRAAAELVARCDGAAGSFQRALVELQAQDEATRGVLLLVLRRLGQDDAAAGRMIQRLCSADRAAAAAAAGEVAERLLRFPPA